MEIFRVLSRDLDFSAIASLIAAYRPEPREIGLSVTAIAFDSSAFLRLGAQTDVIDYLNIHHPAPIILPGQAIQEFWNNHLNVVDTIATGIGKKFEALEAEVRKVDATFLDFSGKFNALLNEFRESFGYAYDGATARGTQLLLEALDRKAMSSFVSRIRFSDIAVHRKRTKTPPGFKDDGDGDFYIWVDMLSSLLEAKKSGIAFEHVVLVTCDKKPDWSRDGIPHPILSAELEALIGTTFEIWDVKRLIDRVAGFTG